MAVQWGLLDPDMAAKVGGSFQQGQKNALMMQGAQQEQRMNALQMQQAEREMESQNALNRAFQESGGDMSKAKSALMMQGQYKPALEIGKIETEQRAADIAARKADVEDKINKIELVSQILSSSHDQASHDQNLQEIASILGPELTKNIPSVYNPTELQFIIKKGESIKDQKYNEIQQYNQVLREREIKALGGYRQATLAQGERQIGMQEQAALSKAAEANQPKPMSEFQQYQIDAKQAEKTAKAEEAIGSIDETIDDFKRLKEIQERTTTGPIAGSAPVVAVRKGLPFDIGGGKDIQRLEKGYADLAVKAIGAFKAGGVTFGALSEKEGKWIKDTQQALNTDKEINKEMLDEGLRMLEGRKSRIAKHLGAGQAKTQTENPSQPSVDELLQMYGGQ